VAIFAYGAVFESADPAQPRTPAELTDRLVRRQALRAALAGSPGAGSPGAGSPGAGSAGAGSATP